MQKQDSYSFEYNSSNLSTPSIPKLDQCGTCLNDDDPFQVYLCNLYRIKNKPGEKVYCSAYQAKTGFDTVS